MTAPPFVFGRIADRDNFVDRVAERRRLVDSFTAGVNTAIISPRRWGKSSLVQRVAEDLAVTDSTIKVVRVDLFNARSEADFYAQLAHGVLQATTTKLAEWVDLAGRFLAHLRPVVSISADHSHSLSLDVDWRQAERSPDEVLDLVEQVATAKGLRLVVCLDEFQSIVRFPGALDFQRKLRAHWQQHQRVCYCLYGSKRHMLLDIFSTPDMPFYRFGDILLLEKIDNATWGDFIADRFAATGKTITAEQGRQIANLVDNHSYYVQQLAQQVWFRTDRVCRDETIPGALTDLTSQLSLVFTGLAESLTARQIRFLQAVLAGEPALTSQAVIKAYDLGTSANVIRIRQALVDKEIIDVNGGAVTLLDPVFRNWLATL